MEECKELAGLDLWRPTYKAFSCRANVYCTFVLDPVHPDDVSKLIDNLKPTKSCALDDIDANIIKLANDDLIAPVTHVINLSTKYQTFP